jgi:superfamily I DNA/RNA helicase
LTKYCSDSLFKNVWQSIKELPDGPIATAVNHEQEAEELKSVFDELKEMTIKQALSYIDSHITFLEEHGRNRSLVVTTIDYAKSQDFDSVFLLGADLLNSRKRWYVSVSRAKQRFFSLISGHPSDVQESNSILSSIPRELYDECFWP